MNRKNTAHSRSMVRLAVKKETLKDLGTKQPVLGGRATSTRLNPSGG
jgi:hypothetical protein